MSAPSTRSPVSDGPDRRLKLAAVGVGVVTVLYGVLVAGQILLPVIVLLGGFVVYLVWRVVRAHERLATAAERIADAQTAAESVARTEVSEASPRQTPHSEEVRADETESEHGGDAVRE